MANEAATKGDKVSSEPGTDVHNCTIANSVVPSACTFSAVINGNVSTNVFVGNKAMATMDSIASESVSHTPALPTNATKIVPEPSTSGKITQGSQTVLINGKGAARHGDPATCCSTTGSVVVQGAGNATVFIGG